MMVVTMVDHGSRVYLVSMARIFTLLQYPNITRYPCVNITPVSQYNPNISIRSFIVLLGDALPLFSQLEVCVSSRSM